MIQKLKHIIHLTGLTQTNGSSLARDVTTSGVWVFGLQFVMRGLSFVKLIVLARILAPSDFGLFGIVLVTLSFLDNFSEVGIDEATIQKKTPTDSYLNTAWMLKILRGILIGGLLFLGAPYIAVFFREPAIEDLLKVIAIVPFINGFINIGVVYFQKDFKFHKYFLYRFSNTIANFVITVALALWLRNVWALVFGMLAEALVAVALSFILHEYRPKIEMAMQHVKDIVNYGKWLFADNALSWLSLEGDDIVVGRMLGTTPLGYYQLAFKVGGFASTEIRSVVARITLPAYAKIQEYPDRIRKAYLKVLVITSALALPIATMTFLLAEPFTLIILGNQWEPIIPVLRVLAIVGAVRAVSGTVGSLLKGIGMPKVTFVMQLPRVVAMFIVIYPLILRFGIVGAAYAELIGLLVFTLIWLHTLKKYVNLSVAEIMVNLKEPLIANASLVFLYVIIIQFIEEWSLGNFLLSGVLLGGVYVLFIGPRVIKPYLAESRMQ